MGYDPTQYERTEVEPYIPLYGSLPDIPPPPPPNKNDRYVLIIWVIAMLVVVIIISSLLFFGLQWYGSNRSTTSTTTPGITVTINPTSVATPTTIPTPVPSVQYTAADIYNDFYVNHLGGPDPKPDTKWSCCTFYPEGGAVIWTADTSGGKLDIATFINNQEAETDAGQLYAIGFPSNVVHGCLLSYDKNVPVSIIQPYVQLMATYCN